MVYIAHLVFNRNESFAPKMTWTLDLIEPFSFTEIKNWRKIKEFDWREDMKQAYKANGWRLYSRHLESLYKAICFYFKTLRKNELPESEIVPVITDCSEAFGLPLGSAAMIWSDERPIFCVWETDSKNRRQETLKPLYKKYACFCKMCPDHEEGCEGKKDCIRPKVCWACDKCSFGAWED